MSKYEKIELTNMCMIYDNNGNVMVQDKINQSWGGITFPGGHIEKQESSVDSVIREVKEETVRKAFLKGNCEVLVILEDSDREILLDDFSSDEDIKKYLGASFINPKR